MSRRKYTFEQRLEVVMHYFASDDGYRMTYRQRGKFMTELQQMPGCRAETRRKPS